MANISILSRMINGAQRNVDLSANTLVVDALMVGGATGTTLTKTILDNLVSLQNGSDAGALHNHDGRYNTKTELAANGGAALIGSSTGDTVETRLSTIESNLGTGTASDIDYLNSTSGLAATNVQTAIDEVEGRVDSAESAITAADSRMDDHVAGTAEKHAASAITFDNTVSGLTATDVKAAIDEVEAIASAAIPLSQKGANNGVATLDAGGKVPLNQLPSTLMTYEGVWDASLNSPALADGVGDTGMTYRVGTSGTQDLGSGSITFTAGDYVIYNGTAWEKSDGTDAVTSVNGQQGVVVLTTDEIAEASNLYYTQARFNSAFAAKTTDDLAEGATNLYFTAARAKAAAVADSITDGVTDVAPSQNAVFDALALKQDASANLDEADTFFGATDISAAEAETLTDGSNADGLHTHSQLKKQFLAGEAFTANVTAVVRMALNGETAGSVYKADKDASVSDKFYSIGLAQPTSALTAGQAINVVLHGTLQLGSGDATFAAGDIGKAVFLTATGGFSTTAPTATSEAVVRVGIVEATNKILVMPGQVIGVN